MKRAMGFIKSMLDQRHDVGQGRPRSGLPAHAEQRRVQGSSPRRPTTPRWPTSPRTTSPAWYSGSGSNFEIIVGAQIGLVHAGHSPAPRPAISSIKSQLGDICSTRRTRCDRGRPRVDLSTHPTGPRGDFPVTATPSPQPIAAPTAAAASPKQRRRRASPQQAGVAVHRPVRDLLRAVPHLADHLHDHLELLQHQPRQAGARQLRGVWRTTPRCSASTTSGQRCGTPCSSRSTRCRRW